MVGAALDAADLTAATLFKVRMSNADLRTANMTSANLAGASLTDARMRDASFAMATITGAQFAMAKAQHAVFLEASGQDAYFDRADLPGADFSGADLRRAHLSRALLALARFTKANLMGANLSYADLGRADFTEALLGGANLTGVELAQANLENARFDRDTVADVDFLAAKWTTIWIAGTRYDRKDVESGDRVMPIGQPTPIRFVFDVRGGTSAQDLQAAQHVVRHLSETPNTEVTFQVTADREVILVDGHGSNTPAPIYSALLTITGMIEDLSVGQNNLFAGQEDLKGEVGQLLSLAARQAVEQDELLRFVRKLELREVRLRTDEEVKRFKTLAKDLRLGNQVTLEGRLLRIADLSRDVVGLLLKVFGFENVLDLLKATDLALTRRERTIARQKEFEALRDSGPADT